MFSLKSATSANLFLNSFRKLEHIHLNQVISFISERTSLEVTSHTFRNLTSHQGTNFSELNLVLNTCIAKINS